MKRHPVLIAGLLLPAAIASAQQPAAKKPAAPAHAATPAHAAAPAAPGAAMKDVDPIVAQEQKVWDSIARQDWAAFAAFLAEDFVEITPGGLIDKSTAVAGVKTGKLTKTNFSDWKVTKLSEGTALVMYKIEYDWAGADGVVAHKTHFCASTWTKQGSGWVARSHQDTDAAPAHAAPAAPDKSGPK